MADPFLGEIRMFGGNFAPKYHALCNGQLIPISQNTALFSILGTTYGGNGTTTFALPDLRGRFPIGAGLGAGLSEQVLGEEIGTPTTALLPFNLPSHTHSLQATTTSASLPSPSGNIWAVAGSRRSTVNLYTATAGTSPAMAVQSLGFAGNSLSHNNQSPYLSISFLIVLQGIFPVRN
jgi:microcystin-dependent protein